MNTEDRLGALASSAIFDSYNSTLRRVYQDIYEERTLVWKTTGKDQVCEVCLGMDLVEFDIEDTYGLLPQHPQCCCSWLTKSEMK